MPVDAAVHLELDPLGWRNLQRSLKQVAPEIQKQLRKEMRGIAGNVAASAKSHASWSSRIPGAIGITVTTTSIGVKANRRKAPHARSYEGILGGGSFRHPLWGNREHWFTEQTRPFLAPAVQENKREFFQAAGAAVEDAARAVGWR